MKALEQEVLTRAHAFIARHARTDEQRRLLSDAVQHVAAPARQTGSASRELACIELPLAVYQGMRGVAAPAVPLAVASLLLCAGMDLLDDLMDGDAGALWSAFGPAELMLAATTLLTALPPLVLVELDAPPTTVIELQRTVAQAEMVLSAGQQRDVLFAESEAVRAEAVEAVAAAKSGEAYAMFASLAAILAGATSEDIDHVAAFGRALGTAQQLRSDFYDLFLAPRSKDLTNGTRTLPVALGLQGLAGIERDLFVELLRRARTDQSAVEQVRTCLRDSGILTACAVVIDLYAHRARDEVTRVTLLEPGEAALLRLADAAVFWPRSKHSKLP